MQPKQQDRENGAFEVPDKKAGIEMEPQKCLVSSSKRH